MAGGSWTTKHVIRDLPASHQAAFSQFHRAPCLMANVAVRNWRFLYKLGITGCQWYEGIGNYFAIRKLPLFGPQSASINPDSPVILTLKILFSKPGLPIDAQTSQGRAELLATGFHDYERQIREQFTQMFARSGFDARRDIAGIILNRWGHAYLSPQPGFFFGNAGNPAPGDFLRSRPFGRLSFANSDLAGIMDHRASIMEAHRAALQAMAQCKATHHEISLRHDCAPAAVFQTITAAPLPSIRASLENHLWRLISTRGRHGAPSSCSRSGFLAARRSVDFKQSLLATLSAMPFCWTTLFHIGYVG
jgi:hypothetical protein